MDSSFTKSFNKKAGESNINKNDFARNLAIKQNNAIINTHTLVKDEEKKYRDFLYEYGRAKFVYDNANEIYREADDPREEANANNLAHIINTLYPTISLDTAKKNYRNIIKGVTGDDMSATNILEVFGKKFGENWSSSWAGMGNYMHLIAGELFNDNAPDEVKQKRKDEYNQQMDALESSIQRTDYYNKDFDSFIQKSFLNVADFLPSEIMSLTPTLVGYALSAVTQMPAFAVMGHAVSGSMAGLMEAGSASLELRRAGADEKTQLAFASVVGVVNGILEYAGNVPERKIGQKLFALNKAVGGIEGHVMKGLVRDVMKEWAFDYGMGLLMEPATEALQELTSMYVMNLASKWQEKNKGKSFTDEFTYTPQEMIDAMKETAVSTFRGQMLLGLTGVGMDAITSLRKGTEGRKNGKFLGMQWDKGDLRKIIESRKYSTYNDNSVLVDSKLIVTDKKTAAYSPKDVDAKGLPTEKLSSVKAYAIGKEYVPINAEEMAKAKYLKSNSEYGMYVDVIEGEQTTAEKASTDDVKRAIYRLPDEIDKRTVTYGYTENGGIVIENQKDLDVAVAEFVTDNVGKVTNVMPTEDGYTVIANGKEYTFTTNTDDYQPFSQTEYVRSAKEAAVNANKEVDADWVRRSEQLVERAKEIQSRDKRYKTSIFRREINKVVDSMITDKNSRDIEKKRINDHVTQISKEVEKATETAIKNSPKSAFAKMFSGRNTADASKSVARGVVMAAAKLAQSMNMNVSQFLSKMTFSFSENTLKEGKERAGWTEVHPDGTFDVKITSLFDQTTGIHEIGHVYLSMLGDNYKSIEGFEQNFKSELESDGGKVGRNTQEAFARALEAYVNEGMAKSEGLRKVFNLVLDALRNFVNAVRDLLTPEKVAMFDNLFEKGLKEYNPTEVEESDETFYAKDVEISDVQEAKRQYDEVVAKYKDTDQWLKAPNGKDSNLSEELWVTVRTDNFKNWFGDWENDPANASKVVDENGEPLVVSHYTDYEFEEFDSSKIGEHTRNYGAFGRGFYFAKTDEASIEWGEIIDNDFVVHRYGENNISAFLNIKNPFDINKDSKLYVGDNKVNKLLKILGYTKEYTDSSDLARATETGRFDKSMTVSLNLKVWGYDGVFAHDEIVAFRPNQIKSAKDNNGTFSNKTGNIYFKTPDDFIDDSVIKEVKRQYDSVVAQYKDTEQWMKAPNGKPTNLTEQGWVAVRTPNFIRWFGDWINDPFNASRVVDENGEPMPVFHGTLEEFNVFMKGDIGFHFGTKEAALQRLDTKIRQREADEYYDTFGDEIEPDSIEVNVSDYPMISAFMNIRNPLDIKNRDFLDWNALRFGKENGSLLEYVSNYGVIEFEDAERIGNLLDDSNPYEKGVADGYESTINKALREALEKEGYDGIRYTNNIEDSGSTSWIAFEKNQIKSVDNIGTFSNADNIYYKTSEELDEMYAGWNDNHTDDSGKDKTQISATRKTYQKLGTFLKKEPGWENLSILDASSGLGYGTQDLREMGFNVEDVEPYSSKDRLENKNGLVSPTYTKYADINKQYDVVISNAVLNVIPDDWRDDLLYNMGKLVKEDGRLYINVRSDKEIESQSKKGEGKTAITLDSPSEILVTDYKNGKQVYRSYQKGFSKSELIDYVQRILGSDFVVTGANKENAGDMGGTTVVATKIGENTVGTSFENINGSKIGRSKFGVGKQVGNQIYVHKNYADEIVPSDVLAKAKELLPADFSYNAIMYDTKKPGAVRFDEAPDFDAAREPVVGDMITVDTDNGSIKKTHSEQIWHHKWEWVKNDYTGFNVKESYDWSRRWTAVVDTDLNRIGSKDIWNEKLKEYGLDEEETLYKDVDVYDFETGNILEEDSEIDGQEYEDERPIGLMVSDIAVDTAGEDTSFLGVETYTYSMSKKAVDEWILTLHKLKKNKQIYVLGNSNSNYGGAYVRFPTGLSRVTPADLVLYVKTRTPSFIKWAGGDWVKGKSDLITDKNGRPQTFYHGARNASITNSKKNYNKFEVFDNNPRGRTLGVFVNNIPDAVVYTQLDSYDYAPNSQTFAVYIKSKKPLIASHYSESGFTTDNDYAVVDFGNGNEKYRVSDLFSIAKEKGYDAIIYKDKSMTKDNNPYISSEFWDYGDDIRTIVLPLYPNNIKEAVLNNGEYSKKNNNVFYKDADLDYTEDEVSTILKEGGFVSNETMSLYENNLDVRIERLAQNIVGTKPEWFKLYKRAEDNYLLETGKTFDKLNGGDKKHILEDWNKRLKGASEYMEVPESGDWVRLINRMHAYAEMESPERADTAFMNSLNHTRNGRENIRNLAVEMDNLGLFKDILEGYNLSARFPALSLIAQKTKSSEKRGTRPRIDVSVYDQAKDEAFRNRQFIREQMNDENTNAYESNAREADTNTNYIESEDIQNILKEKGVSGRVKEIVRDGIWNGTVVRDLMEETTRQLSELNASNRTIESTQRELDIERERVKIYEAEIEELEKGISKKNAANVNNLKSKLSEAKTKIYNLELQNKLLADMVALERLDAAIYKTKRQVQDLVKKNTGEADVSRALRKTVNSIINFTKKARAKNPNLEVKIDLNRMKYNLDEEGNIIKDSDGNPEKGKAPVLAKFLEENGFVDKDGKLLKGFEDMNVSTLKAFKSAVKTDKENSIDRQKIRQREFNANIENIANKIVSSMRSRKIEKNLTNEDKQRIREEVESQSEGKNLDRNQLNDLERQITGKVIAEKIKDIADGARYGIESHTEAVGKKHVLDDFTTLSRLLGAISPELRQFVMDGLNKATDGKYRNVESRMKTFYSNIKEEYKLKTDKDVRNFFNKVVNTRQEIGRVSYDEIPERLKKNKLFMKMWDADEKTGANKKPANFLYSIQDLMAIEEQSLEWDGLRHLNNGCGVTAAEIAWTVREFETENGSLNYYKAAADEIRRVYGERFQQLYDTVLNVENREMIKVSFYSPMFGVGLNKDLMMKFSDVFGDDRTAQANWFTKDREFGTNAIDLSYYSRLEKVVEMQEAYINGAEFYKQLNHLFSEDGGNLRNIITEVYDASTFKRIETILDLTKTDAVRNVITEADSMASTIRNHYVMARLAYNFSSVLQQVGSWFLGLRDYGLGQMWKASIQFILHPIEMSNRVYELSPQLKHNVNPLLQMAKESMKTNPKTALGKIDKFVTSIGNKGLTLMEKQDHIIRNILFWTAYQSELSKAQAANKGAELTYEQMDQCQRNATQWVLDIQSSSQVKDNSLMYSGNNLFWKQVLMFTNQLNKEWNMLYVDGIKEGLFQKQYGKFFANFAALGLATMWIVAITGKIKNDEDDDETWAEDLLKDWGFEFMSRAPLVGNTVKNVYEGFAYRQNDDIVTRLTQAIATLANEKATTKKKATALKNFGWSGLDLFGAPTTAIKRLSQSLDNGEITSADHFMRLFGGEWYKYFEE